MAAILFIFSFSGKGWVGLMKKQLIQTVVATFFLLLLVEVALHITSTDGQVNPFFLNKNIYQEILNAPLLEKEIDNRFIRHNILLLDNLDNKDTISIGFVGTSRTKALQPSRFGISNAFNSGSNSYNEITYGLLLEAIVLRDYLPNLKRVYIESSMLLRRPAAPHFIVEKEHLIYLPMLRRLLDLRKLFPQFEAFKNFVTGENAQEFKILLLTEGKRFTVANLIGIRSGSKNNDRKLEQSKVFQNLTETGEYLAVLPNKNDTPKAAISIENPRVSRIKDVMSYEPFDYLFEMFVAWSKSRGIEIIFVQPPVRSDMLFFQYKYGLEFHNQELERLAEENNVKVINMNFINNGFSEDWEIFSDEDHLATCMGNAVFFTALSHGEHKVDSSGKYYQEISMNDIKGEIPHAKESFCRK